MKKLSVLVALALLAVAGTGYAVVCAYDNVPGATLLIPYFRVSGAVDATGKVDASGTDTLVSFVNVSDPGIIAHVTVWNKYSKAVFDFNVPMTGKDVVFFSMRDVLNGKLNVNNTSGNTGISPILQKTGQKDVCGLNLNVSPAVYNATPYIGWGSQNYLRFKNPESVYNNVPGADHLISVSIYKEPDAFLPQVRAIVMNSLDESGDIGEMQDSGGTNILDVNNPACGLKPTVGVSAISGQFSGYVTIDVVNYCTNHFPDQDVFYTNDAVATSGWDVYGYSPNVLIGDVFYIDQTANSGNISGDQAVALEFDYRLGWYNGYAPTFYGNFVAFVVDNCERNGGTGSVCGGYNNVPGIFQFGGDGREPLGDRYGFRYLNNSAAGLRTWLLVWRSDIVYNPGIDEYTVNLCEWLIEGGPGGDPDNDSNNGGFFDLEHALVILTYDNDEGSFSNPTCPPGYPSPCPPGAPPTTDYVFLEANRIDLFGNTQANPAGYIGGWMDVQFRATNFDSGYNQAWAGVQHTAPGTLMNVGHSATSLFAATSFCWDWVFGLSFVPPTEPLIGFSSGLDDWWWYYYGKTAPTASKHVSTHSKKGPTR